jgi:hypothetical protein
MRYVCTALLVAASAFCYPTCGKGQIKVGSLTDCAIGNVNLTNWSFSAPGYTGNATVKIGGATDYNTDPETITLKFPESLLGGGGFSLSFIATLTNGYEFNKVTQEWSSGKIPSGATVTGDYNTVSTTNDGATLFAEHTLAPNGSVTVTLTGAPPPACRKCNGEAEVRIGLYQGVFETADQTAVPEPFTMGLAGFGLIAFAAARRHRAYRAD